MDLLPTLGLLGVLLLKEAGVPIPVPGDLLVLGAGIAAAGTGVLAAVLLAAILAAGYIGGSLQFALVRGPLREPILRLLGRFGVSREQLDRLAGWVRRRGVRGVAVARATPGLRVGAISASGIAGLSFTPFLGGLVVGNGVFVGGHFLVGFLVGPPALAAIAATGGLVVGVVVFLALAALGAILWRRLRARRGSAAAGDHAGIREAGVSLPVTRSPMDLAGVATWAEAACPACLGVTVAARLLGPESAPRASS